MAVISTLNIKFKLNSRPISIHQSYYRVRIRNVVRRLCNKDRDQGPKGIGIIGRHGTTRQEAELTRSGV